MKTFRIAEKDIEHKVWLVNADGKTLGRLATKVAELLIGKGKPYFAKDQIVGDFAESSPLILKPFCPGKIQTRAIDVLRRPVA